MMTVCQPVPETVNYGSPRRVRCDRGDVVIAAGTTTIRAGMSRWLHMILVVAAMALGGCLQDMEPSPGAPDAGSPGQDAATNVDAAPGSDAAPPDPDAGVDDGGMGDGGMGDGGMGDGGMDAGPDDGGIVTMDGGGITMDALTP